MANLIDFILNLNELKSFKLTNFGQNKNRANSVGDGLEIFVKDCFSGAIATQNKNYYLAHI